MAALSSSTHSTTETVRCLQVGHRDLEDILRDIDLNGDGHVDFEGEGSLTDIEKLARWFLASSSRHSTFIHSLSSMRLTNILCHMQIYGERVHPISRRQANREMKG